MTLKTGIKCWKMLKNVEYQVGQGLWRSVVLKNLKSDRYWAVGEGLKFSDSMYNYLQRPNQVLAGRLPPMTLKTCTLGHPKCLKMLTAYWGKTYKGQMVWYFWDLIVIKELPKVWKLSDAMHHLQVLAGKLPKYTLKHQCTAHPKCLKTLPA